MAPNGRKIGSIEKLIFMKARGALVMILLSLVMYRIFGNIYQQYGKSRQYELSELLCYHRLGSLRADARTRVDLFAAGEREIVINTCNNKLAEARKDFCSDRKVQVRTCEKK